MMKYYHNDFGEYKIYNLKEVLNNFSDYFGITFDEMVNIFTNYKVISKCEVIDYIKNNQDIMRENQYQKVDVNNIIEIRLKDYQYFYDYLAILSHKAINYLSLLKYISTEENVCKKDEWYDTILKHLEIFHFGNGMVGGAINELFVLLSEIKKEFEEMLVLINSLETYNVQKIDSFASYCMQEKICQTDCVMVTDGVLLNKTSLNRTKEKMMVRKII